VRRSREFSTAWLHRFLVVAVVLTAAALAAQAQAQTRAPPAQGVEPGSDTTGASSGTFSGASTGPGAEALDRARAAWDKGDYDIAFPLYREAVETGGLTPDDVLEAYVHLGATCSVLGKKTCALAAFRSAALIRPQFAVPAEAGKRAAVTADKARRGVARVGGISLHADFPAEVDTGESAQVDATLDAGHLGVATHVALSARDPLSGKAYNDVEDSAPSVHFKVPTTLALPGATLVLRVDALDAHQNRLASVDGKTHVRAPVAVAAAVPVAAGAHGAAALRGSFSSGGIALAGPAADASKGSKKKSFWATPWPYVIGGVALAAGATAIYFATRPSDDVNLGAVQVGLSK
jgi:hypothetical protein